VNGHRCHQPSWWGFDSTSSIPPGPILARASADLVHVDLVHSSVIRRRAIIHGHVQGVFFREETRRHASARGVGGWVCNLPDGTVEAVFEGEPDAVEELLEFAASGPALARVDRVDVEGEEPQGLSGFEVR